MNKKFKRSKGFSLVELITVVVILGIIGTVALGKFEDLSEDAHTASARKSMVEFERTAAMTIYNYAIERDADPTTVTLRPGVTLPVNAQGWPGAPFDGAACLNLWQTIMISSEPMNPLSFPITNTAQGWEYWGNGSVCIYLYKPDTTPLKAVIYNPAARIIQIIGV